MSSPACAPVAMTTASAPMTSSPALQAHDGAVGVDRRHGDALDEAHAPARQVRHERTAQRPRIDLAVALDDEPARDGRRQHGLQRPHRVPVEDLARRRLPGRDQWLHLLARMLDGRRVHGDDEHPGVASRVGDAVGGELVEHRDRPSAERAQRPGAALVGPAPRVQREARQPRRDRRDAARHDAQRGAGIDERPDAVADHARRGQRPGLRGRHPAGVPVRRPAAARAAVDDRDLDAPAHETERDAQARDPAADHHHGPCHPGRTVPPRQDARSVRSDHLAFWEEPARVRRSRALHRLGHLRAPRPGDLLPRRRRRRGRVRAHHQATWIDSSARHDRARRRRSPSRPPAEPAGGVARGDHLGATGGAAARAAVRPAHRGRRRPCPRVARRARAVLRHAVAGGAREHLGRARDVPRHPVVLARRVRRQLPGQVPHGARGRAHGPHARADARGARRDPRRPRDPLPRPPAQAAGADADRVRRRARAGLQRVARRPVGVRRARPARVHHRLQPRPRRGRPRDRALRPAPGRSSASTSPAPASTPCGATAATTRSTPPPRPPTSRSCCTA